MEQPKRYDPGIMEMLGMDADPFRNGNDLCSVVHTNAGRYRRTLNDLRDFGTSMGEPDFLRDLAVLGDCYRNILAAGYRMCEVTARVYVLGMVS